MAETKPGEETMATRIGDVLPQTASLMQTQTSSIPPEAAGTEPALSREDYARLVPVWKHMTGMYGSKFTSQYGERVHETWVRILKDVDDQGLATGMHACVHRASDKRRTGDDDWPPTANEFRFMCKPYRPEIHQKRIPLEVPKRTPEQLKEIEDDMRRLRRLCQEGSESLEQQRRERLWDLRRRTGLTLRQMLSDDDSRVPGEDDDI